MLLQNRDLDAVKFAEMNLIIVTVVKESVIMTGIHLDWNYNYKELYQRSIQRLISIGLKVRDENSYGENLVVQDTGEVTVAVPIELERDDIPDEIINKTKRLSLELREGIKIEGKDGIKKGRIIDRRESGFEMEPIDSSETSSSSSSSSSSSIGFPKNRSSVPFLIPSSESPV
jgi:hypothetical protein